MKRNIELLRCILETIENDENEFFKGDFVFEDKYTPKQISYHKKLLVEAGYIKTSTRENEGRYTITELTWEGHEYLNGLRKYLDNLKLPHNLRQ